MFVFFFFGGGGGVAMEYAKTEKWPKINSNTLKSVQLSFNHPNFRIPAAFNSFIFFCCCLFSFFCVTDVQTPAKSMLYLGVEDLRVKQGA